MPEKDEAAIYQEILQQKVTNPHRGKKKDDKNKVGEVVEIQNSYREGANIFQVTKDPGAIM